INQDNDRQAKWQHQSDSLHSIEMIYFRNANTHSHWRQQHNCHNRNGTARSPQTQLARAKAKPPIGEPGQDGATASSLCGEDGFKTDVKAREEATSQHLAPKYKAVIV